MQTNRFQGIIITDTVHSYCIFSYACGDIQWSGHGSETAIVGYNSHGKYKNHPANGLADIGRIISCRRRECRILYSLPANEDLQTAKSECTRMANDDDRNFQNIANLRNANNERFVAILPRCPPTQAQVLLSSEFMPFTAQDGDCYRSYNTFMPRPVDVDGNILHFVSVCCYDTNANG